VPLTISFSGNVLSFDPSSTTVSLFSVTYASLCQQSQALVHNAALANGLCSLLTGAQRAEAAGLPGAKAQLLRSYSRLVAEARALGYLSADQATFLDQAAALL
jgi:hypothetical protein